MAKPKKKTDEHKALIAIATEMNQVADLDPAIDLELDEDDLAEAIAENAGNIYTTDKVSPDLKKYFKKNKLEMSEPDAEEEGEEGGKDDADDAPDFDDMDLKELLAYAEENDIDVPKKLKKDEDALREHIKDASVPDDETGDDETEEEPDLDDMDAEELLDFAKERGIKLAKDVKKSGKAKKIRAAIKEALEEGVGADDDDDEKPAGKKSKPGKDKDKAPKEGKAGRPRRDPNADPYENPPATLKICMLCADDPEMPVEGVLKALKKAGLEASESTVKIQYAAAHRLIDYQKKMGYLAKRK